MHSTINPAHRLTVEIEQTPGLGSIWVVRVFRKTFFFRRLVSSDWFLDKPQAQRFADQVTGEMQSETGVQYLRDRKPGWTLRRPAH